MSIELLDAWKQQSCSDALRLEAHSAVTAELAEAWEARSQVASEVNG